MTVLNDADKKLYDRQIRLFGYSTQEKIKTLKVKIISSNLENKEIRSTNNISFIAGEILKNFALLGVVKISACRETQKSFSYIVPNTIKDINKEINLITIDEFVEGNLDVYVLIELLENNVQEFYLCSKCLCYGVKNDHLCVINNKYMENNKMAAECLLGAVFVQEIVKMISGERYRSDYKVNL